MAIKSKSQEPSQSCLDRINLFVALEVVRFGARSVDVSVAMFGGHGVAQDVGLDCNANCFK